MGGVLRPPLPALGLGMRSRWRSVVELPELALPQLPQGLERLRRIGKQIESRGRIAPDDHCATFDLVIHPVRRHSERPGQLRDGEGTCHPPRVRLRAMLHEADIAPCGRTLGPSTLSSRAGSLGS